MIHQLLSFLCYDFPIFTRVFALIVTERLNDFSCRNIVEADHLAPGLAYVTSAKQASLLFNSPTCIRHYMDDVFTWNLMSTLIYWVKHDKLNPTMGLKFKQNKPRKNSSYQQPWENFAESVKKS